MLITTSLRGLFALFGSLALLAAPTFAAEDPSQTFIQTLNQLRQKRGLPTMRLDGQINQSAQWLADHMARHDVMDHDAVVVGGKQFANMRGIGERLKNFGFIDINAAEACAQGEAASDTEATRDFTLGWANGKTHYRPFLSKDGQVFETCGYGIARSRKNPKEFYACALFATRDPSTPAPAAAAAGGAPMPAAGGAGNKIDKVLNVAAAIAELLKGGKSVAPGTAVGGMALQFAPGWTTLNQKGVITYVNPEGTARVIIKPVAGPKDAADGPWDAI
jgi:uncharacterized protein YkwD